ncbi:MAG: hypothetical protein QOE58_1550 [Actinomycetota bacterium]|nr:hypothetical protein [Actinomycetota bacterium]
MTWMEPLFTRREAAELHPLFASLIFADSDYVQVYPAGVVVYA